MTGKDCCKGICKSKHGTVGTHIDGKPMCRTCCTFIEWEGNWCPCCKCRLSRRARGIESKSLEIKMENVKRY